MNNQNFLSKIHAHTGAQEALMCSCMFCCLCAQKCLIKVNTNFLAKKPQNLQSLILNTLYYSDHDSDHHCYKGNYTENETKATTTTTISHKTTNNNNNIKITNNYNNNNKAKNNNKTNNNNAKQELPKSQQWEQQLSWVVTPLKLT